MTLCAILYISSLLVDSIIIHTHTQMATRESYFKNVCIPAVSTELVAKQLIHNNCYSKITTQHWCDIYKYKMIMNPN